MRTFAARRLGIVLTSLLLPGILGGAAAVSAARHPVDAAAPIPPASSLDLRSALAPDGAFRGAPGLAGTVDTGSWTLSSDLSTGEAPRFKRTSDVLPATADAWSALGANTAGTNGALNEIVLAIAVSGSDVYVGGYFQNVAGIAAADYVAKWDGSSWAALGNHGAGVGALNDAVRAIAVSGTDVFVGGDFQNAAGIAKADYVARWDGSTWSALGGSSNGALTSYVEALAVSGTDLFVGGSFTDAAGVFAADYVAKWNGSAWSALGSNGFGDGAINFWACDPEDPGDPVCGPNVNALAVSGSDLYVGGDLGDVAGDAEADYVVMWNGSAWSALGSNGSGDGALGALVTALAVSGATLYVGGVFQNVAGLPTADGIAAWSGSIWSALGSNGSGNGPLGHNGEADALAIVDGDLYVGGAFLNAGGIGAADSVARWDGSAWSALGSNGSGDGALRPLSGHHYGVYALAALGSDVVVGGGFGNVAGLPQADYVADWGVAGVVVKPDGRIRLGTAAFVGNDVYNTTGTGQSKTGSAAKGRTITFGISVQNDGNATDSFLLQGTGTASSGYTVKYVHGATDITAAVVAGSFQTPTLAPGATYLIGATVKVKASAATGSKVTRLVTISSVAQAADKDAVKFVGKRAG